MVGTEPYDLTLPSDRYGGYRGPIDCVWTIQNGNHEKIRLDIQPFRFSRNAADLVIGFGNNTNSTVVQTLAGTSEMTRVLFPSRAIWLEFWAPYISRSWGFRLVLRAVGKTFVFHLIELRDLVSQSREPHEHCRAQLKKIEQGVF